MPVAKRRSAQVAFLLSALLAASAVLACAASAKTVGIVPPHNPKRNCDHSADVSYRWTLASIDRCRALERVGPMVLPNNWRSLTPAQKLLVIIDLERVNRGLAPIAGLSPELNALARQGAHADADPGPPDSGSFSGGSIWAGAGTVFEADYGWMYDDGWGALHINVDCTGPHKPGCWGHRDNILLRSGSTIVGGSGYATAKATHQPYNSYAFEMLAGYSQSGLAFTWAAELAHFATTPTLEPLQKPTVVSVSPRSGAATGGTRVLIRGTNLEFLTKVEFGSARGVFLHCPSQRRCTVVAPAHKPGTVTLTAVNPAGGSPAGTAASFTYRGR